MKRLTLYLAVAALTFGIGISSQITRRPYSSTPHHPEILRIHVSLAKEHMNESFPNPAYHIYEISVENVSDRTVRGYALNYEDTYGPGYLAPCSCDGQTLRPGETKTRMVGGFTEGLKVGLDEVRFAGD